MMAGNRQVMDLFANRRIEELNDWLSERPNIDLIGLVDPQGNTLLHQLAFEDHLDIIKLFVKYVRRFLESRGKGERKKLYQKDVDQEIAAWMNRKNNQGFTPLLYASYSGHLDVIRYLVEEFRVNQTLVTNTGLNPLHLAAQKNKVLPFMYFSGRISLDEEDKLHSTALHWAAYMNSEQVTAYILSEDKLQTLNHRDEEGNTPLMLAVTYGNTRVVRRLLIKGADRYLRNNQRKLPIDIARESEYKTITKMLNEDYSSLDILKFYCNVKIQYRPNERSIIMPTIFLVGLITNLFIINFLVKFTMEEYSFFAEGASFGIMLLLYLTLLWGPSKVERHNLTDFMNQRGIKRVCFDCRSTQPNRGYHCDICKVCIQQYDHHCTWINNCVGKRNLARFIFFVFFLLVCLAFLGLLSCLSAISLFRNDKQMYKEWFILRYPPDGELEKYLELGLLAINLASSIFVFPVLMLFIVQIKNLLRNKTTYETMRGPPDEQNESKKKLSKYSHKVSLRNCRVMCSDTQSSFTTCNKSSSGVEQLISQEFPSQKIDH